MAIGLLDPVVALNGTEAILFEIAVMLSVFVTGILDPAVRLSVFHTGLADPAVRLNVFHTVLVGSVVRSSVPAAEHLILSLG